ncbi:MAG TPA: hypothetical protein VNE62_06415 [Actinomycetota bacterium]|nr:hypothetical protein [Actinomycetota bacterium]
MRRRLIPLFATLVLATVAVPAVAEDRGTIALPAEQSVTQTFPAITSPAPPSILWGQLGPTACRDPVYAKSCDVVFVKPAMPEGYEHVFIVDVVLTWKKTTSNNLLDLYLWTEDEGELSGPPSASDDSVADVKRVEFGEPVDGFWLTVVNFRGVNAGYTLEINWRRFDLGSVPQAPPEPDLNASTDIPSAPSSLPRAGDTFGDDDSSFDPGFGPKEQVRTRKVLIPGPDGELRQVALPVLARGDRAPTGSGGIDPFAATLVLIGLLGASASVFFVIRRRHLSG